MGSKFRLALAGLTAAALIGGVMVADPADAGKKKHKKVKVKKVKKVKKSDSVKQVSKGGNATAGNGGNGGAGGSSGNVNNTGNVTGGASVPGTGLAPAFVDCVNGWLALDGAIIFVIELGGCVADFPPGPALPAFEDCLGPAGPDGRWTAAEVVPCLDVTSPGTGSGVFSGTAGNGGSGGAGGNAIGGNGGSNTNTNTVTVTRNDHSIGVG